MDSFACVRALMCETDGVWVSCSRKMLEQNNAVDHAQAQRSTSGALPSGAIVHEARFGVLVSQS